LHRPGRLRDPVRVLAGVGVPAVRHRVLPPPRRAVAAVVAGDDAAGNAGKVRVLMREGVFRFIPLDDVHARLDDGWRIAAADLGPYHGRFAGLMWWCCGECMPGEAP